MRGNATDCVLARNMLEWNVPEEVVALLLKDSAIARKHI